MPFLLRLLAPLSLLAILVGVMIKINHWHYDGMLFMNAGIVGIAIYFVGNFISGELKRKKESKR